MSSGQPGNKWPVLRLTDNRVSTGCPCVLACSGTHGSPCWPDHWPHCRRQQDHLPSRACQLPLRALGCRGYRAHLQRNRGSFTSMSASASLSCQADTVLSCTLHACRSTTSKRHVLPGSPSRLPSPSAFSSPQRASAGTQHLTRYITAGHGRAIASMPMLGVSPVLYKSACVGS